MNKIFLILFCLWHSIFKAFQNLFFLLTTTTKVLLTHIMIVIFSYSQQKLNVYKSSKLQVEGFDFREDVDETKSFVSLFCLRLSRLKDFVFSKLGVQTNNRKKNQNKTLHFKSLGEIFYHLGLYYKTFCPCNLYNSTVSCMFVTVSLFQT